MPINLINSGKNYCGICSLTYATWKHNSWGISWNVLLFHSVSTSDLQQHYWKHWFKGTVHPEINYCQSLFWICKSHSFPCNYSEWRLTSSKKLASSIGLQGSEETSPLLDATLMFYTLIYASILTHAELHQWNKIIYFQFFIFSVHFNMCIFKQWIFQLGRVRVRVRIGSARIVIVKWFFEECR